MKIICSQIDRDKIASLIEESMQNQCPASLHNSPLHLQNNNNTLSFQSMTAPATLDITVATNGISGSQQQPNLATPPIGLVNSMATSTQATPPIGLVNSMATPTTAPASAQVPMHTTS